MRPAVLAAMALASCQGYQLEPGVRVGYGESTSSSWVVADPGIAVDGASDGWQAWLDLTARPPVVIDDYQFMRLEAALRDAPAPTPKEDPGDKSWDREISAAKDFGWEDWLGLSAVLLVLALVCLAARGVVAAWRGTKTNGGSE